MFTDLLNQSVKSSFNGYNNVPMEPAAVINPGMQSEFCNKLVNPSRNLDSIQQVAGHNFSVEMKPVNVQGIEIPGKAIACEAGTTNFLGNGVVGSSYEPMQPDDLYGIAKHLLSLDDTIQVTDTITRVNRYMIGLQLNKGEWSPTGDFADRIMNNLVLFTTFDGSKPTSLRTVSFRPICSNQYASTKHLFSIRHTRNAPVKVAELKRLLTQVTYEMDQANAQIQSLVYKSMTNGQATEWFNKLLLNGKDYADLKGRGKTTHDNKMSDFERLLTSGAGCEAGQGTRYAAFNALTNYCTHERATRVTGNNGSESEIRWESNLFGSSADFAQRGTSQLVTM